MDFTLNIKIEATPEFCRTLDHIAAAIMAAGANAAPPMAEPEKETPPAPKAQETPAPMVPTAPAPAPAPAYTQDQLALAASGLVDAGKMAELQALLATFGVPSLVELPKTNYNAFAEKLVEMGAKL